MLKAILDEPEAYGEHIQRYEYALINFVLEVYSSESP